MKSLVEKIRNVGIGTVAVLAIGGLTTCIKPVHSTTHEIESESRTEISIENIVAMTPVTTLVSENTAMLEENSMYGPIMLDEIVIVGKWSKTIIEKKQNREYNHMNSKKNENVREQRGNMRGRFGFNKIIPGKDRGNIHYAMLRQNEGHDKLMQGKGKGNEHYGMLRKNEDRSKIMQERTLYNREQSHKSGYVTMQRGDYTIGRIETPKETIIYRFKTSELTNNAEKIKLVTGANDLIKQYNLKKYDAKEMRPNFQDKEKGRTEYRHSLEDFKKGIRQFNNEGLEKKLGSLEKLESGEIDHQKMAEHFKQYGKHIENRSKEWENYAKEHKDLKDFRNHPDINKWHNDMNKWGREDLGKWQNDAMKYMQRNVERKTFPDGEYFLKIQKNDSIGKYFPMPPNFPRPPLNQGNYHR